MRWISAYLLASFFLPSWARADSYPRQPSVDVLHYEIEIELRDDTDEIRATARVHVRMREDGVRDMWLDFRGMRVERLRMRETERAFDHREGRLRFDLAGAYTRGEIAVVEIDYRGTPAEAGLLIGRNNHGRRVFFSENWPDRARYWIPSIDHPSDKATVEFTVTAPDRYEVVANGRPLETRSLLDGRKRTRWREDRPIPTYCMVIGVAEFAVLNAGVSGSVPMTWYVYPQDSEAAARKFRRSALALQLFSELIGPYPYSKLAQVQSSTRIGGMENANTIFYAERAFQLPQVAEAPVPHEIAHQWFGDSITPSDWDHLWLSEGFATYFDALFYEHLEGSQALKGIMARAAEAVERLHQSRPAPIIDPSLTDPTAKLNANNYQKGAWVLHMLRGILGDESFFSGIRTYYSRFAGGNALSEDFQRVMESVSGVPLEVFFRQWLYRAGWPEYRVAWRWDADVREVEIEIRQTQKSGLFDMPVEIVVRSAEASLHHKTRIRDAVHTVRLTAPIAPESVEIDPAGWILKTVAITP